MTDSTLKPTDGHLPAAGAFPFIRHRVPARNAGTGSLDAGGGGGAG